MTWQRTDDAFMCTCHMQDLTCSLDHTLVARRTCLLATTLCTIMMAKQNCDAVQLAMSTLADKAANNNC